MARKGPEDLSKVASRIRVGLEKVKPKMTYQFAIAPTVKFVSKEKYAKQLEAGIAKANKVIETELTKALNEAMEAPVWKWTPGVTTDRKNGSSVESPRDIVDTGALRDSFRINTKKGTVDFAYREPYSRMVHYGGYIKPFGKPDVPKVYLPPRPWITSVLYGENGFEAFPFKDIWRKAIQAEFSR
jgi:hypothetical protein